MSFQLLSLTAIILGQHVSLSQAQYPPHANYPNILKSPLNPQVIVSYKTPSVGTCATVFSTQKQFTGYITLPPQTLAPIQQNYSINTFFWFVEARQKPETAPLTIWLNGGPGSSSMIGFFTENGPCEVVPLPDGSYGTQAQLWGWDRSSNMLYIDQPVQVGLSFDRLTNGSLDLLQGNITAPPMPYTGAAPPYTYLNGTFSSQEHHNTANTTQIAAQAVWHFLQTWLNTFPQYNPGKQPNDTNTYPTGVNLFTESYGGTYGPVFADFFDHQNDLLHVGQLPADKTLEIELVSLGIMNGQVDFRIQAPFLPMYANNNTYGIQAITTAQLQDALTSMQAPNGCLARLDQCRKLQDTQDVFGEGDVASVNAVCANAFDICSQYQNLLSSSGRDIYDIRSKTPSVVPSWAFMEYLNMAQVQEALGVSINFTNINPVLQDFVSTGDHLRGTQLPALGRLLDRGIRVALIYGDADFICNWQGGEAISLSLATLLPRYSIPFPFSGYAQIVVNSSFVGGAVRQFGNLSFARIYDAGHLVPAYQPETAFTVFTRVIEGTGIATGERVDLTNYSTFGSQFSTKTNKVGSTQAQVCWIRNIQDTCTADQRTQILAGKGVVMSGMWLADASNYNPPTSSVAAGSPGKPAPNVTMGWSSGTPSVLPTGVYTATSTPLPNLAPVKFALGSWCQAVILLIVAFLSLRYPQD